MGSCSSSWATKAGARLEFLRRRCIRNEARRRGRESKGRPGFRGFKSRINDMRFFLQITVLFLAPLLAGRAADSTNLTNAYARDGQLIVAHLASAPFPHPDRADGHKYKEEVFDAATHYSDDTVAIFIPRDYRPTGRLDLVVHFHGWRNHVSEVLRQYRLIEQLMASGRNAILVVPQGPYEAADSFGGKLEDKDGFKRFVADVVATIGEKTALKTNDLSLGRIIL